MHVLCRCARSLRSTRAPGLRWRRARFGLAKGCQQHQVKVMEGFGYTVASLPCSEHTHSHLPGQPSSGSGHLRPSGRSGRETTPRRARGPLAPAFRPSELRSVCPRPARRATGVARAALSSSSALRSQHRRRELQTAPKSRARWRAVVGRQLGGSSAAKGLLTTSMGVVEGRSHPGQRLVVRVRTPRRPRQACWGGGVGGPLRRWLAKGSAAADKTRPAGGAIRVRFIATDFVGNAQELPEQRRCHHRGPLRALCARANQGSKTSHSYKHRLLKRG